MSLSCLRLLWGHSWSSVFRRSLAERRNELEILHRQLGPPPSRQGGAEDYMHGPKRVPPASISQADLLNGGASQGGSLLELPDKQGAKRSKSPFSLFKKVRDHFWEGRSALQEDVFVVHRNTKWSSVDDSISNVLGVQNPKD